MPYCPGGRLDNDDENWERAWLIPGTTTKFVIGIVVLSKPGLWKDLAVPFAPWRKGWTIPSHPVTRAITSMPA